MSAATSSDSSDSGRGSTYASLVWSRNVLDSDVLGGGRESRPEALEEVSRRQEWYDEPVEPYVEPVVVVVGKNIRIIGAHLHATITDLGKAYAKLGASLANHLPPASTESETPRERALRLTQQPHSMAQNSADFHFDHRGRRRY
jgi:hypothetical protein